jgi:hypothetical protein
MSNVTTQEIKFTNSAKPSSSTMYVKTGALTDAQIEKGIYMSINAGDAIEGFLKDVSTDAKYGKPQYTIETFDGRTLVVSGSGNLPARLAALNVSIGDPVQLNYNGKVPMKSGKYKGTPAHNWRVEVAE